MVLLDVVAGTLAEGERVARRFPFRVGRGTQSHLRLEAAGVWENHFRIERSAGHGLTLRTEPGAITLLNGRPTSEAGLRPGDVIEAGGARLLFWLSPPLQAGLAVRETLTWVGLGLLVAFQVFVAASLTP